MSTTALPFAPSPGEPLLGTFNPNTRVGQLLRKRGLRTNHASLIGATGDVMEGSMSKDKNPAFISGERAAGGGGASSPLPPSSEDDDDEAVRAFASTVDVALSPPAQDGHLESAHAAATQRTVSALSRRSPRRGRMPCQSDLAQMLPEVRATIEEHAINIMKLLLYPKVFARCRRKQQANASRAALRNAIRLTPQLLKSLYKGFQPWPDEALTVLASKFRFEHFDVRSYVVHAGEPSAGGAYVVVSGSTSVINPWSGSRKSATGPFAIGMNSMLDGTPHTATYITSTRVDAWHIFNDDFLSVFHTLPTPVVERTISIAFEAKNRKLLEEHPMTVEVMKRSPIFAACPVSVLQELVRFTVPYCVPRQHVLCQAGTAAQRIVFPLRGRCNVVPVDRPAYPLPDDAVFGEDAVLTSGKHTESLVTVTELDCYVLRKTLFDSAIRVIVEVPEALHAAFRVQRERQIDRNRMLWSLLMAKPPLVGDLVDEAECIASLSRLCVPRVYSPMTVICSSGQYCACVIMVLTGTIRVGDGDTFPRLTRGSYAGYTGIIKHRWAAAAVSEGLVETLEIPIDLYTAWLKDHSIYAEVKSRTLRLMFPKAFPRHEALAAAALLQRGALGLHPVSNARSLSRAHTTFIAEVGPSQVGEVLGSSFFSSAASLDNTFTTFDGLEAFDGTVSNISPIRPLDSRGSSSKLPRVATPSHAASKPSRSTTPALASLPERPTSPTRVTFGHRVATAASSTVASGTMTGNGSRPPTAITSIDRPLHFTSVVSVTPTPYAKTKDDDTLNRKPTTAEDNSDDEKLGSDARPSRHHGITKRPASHKEGGTGGGGLNRMTKASAGMWIRRS